MLRVLHFLVLGALVFAAERAACGSGAAETPVVIPAQAVEALRSGWRERTGAEPDPRTLEALVREQVDEALLFRRALDLGLHRSDPVVVRRLLRNMRFVEADPDASDAALLRRARALGMERTDPVVRRRLVQRVRDGLRQRASGAPPDDAALRAYAERHRERFATPERVAFHQVFVAPARPAAGERARHGEQTEARARRLRAALVAEGAGPEAAAARGDPSALPARVGPASHREVARRFGEPFADRVWALEPGGWHGPVASPYGLHLVWVTGREPGALPPLPAIRGRVERAIRAEREAEALRRGLAALRERYPVRVAGRPDPPTP